MKNKEIVESVFENTTTGKKHPGKMVYINGEYTGLKLYDRTSVIRRLTYIGINENPDLEKIEYREIIT
jgi:hypothetical protein